MAQPRRLSGIIWRVSGSKEIQQLPASAPLLGRCLIPIQPGQSIKKGGDKFRLRWSDFTRGVANK
jgi:hypothetical protein